MTLGGILGSRLIKKGLLPWWTAGGLISRSDVIAAYKAIGAASLAASYVNLANPGTYDLAVVTAAPTWASGTGWTFAGAGALNTGITIPAGQVWSFVIRVSNVTADTYLCGNYNNTDTYHAIRDRIGSNNISYRHGSGATWIQAINPEAAAVIAGVSDYPYRNGLADSATAFIASANAVPNFYIGAAFNSVTLATLNPLIGNVQAFVIAKIALSAAQMLALSTKIAALT